MPWRLRDEIVTLPPNAPGIYEGKPHRGFRHTTSSEALAAEPGQCFRIRGKALGISLKYLNFRIG